MTISPALAAAAASEPTPLLILDRSVLRQTYFEMAESLPGALVHYAVKANPHPAVLAELAEQGCGFEISSLPELDSVLELGVSPERVISSNPVKRPDFIQRAARLGIDRFAFDSEAELEKLARWAPGSRVYVRMTVDNSGSEWPLSKKYGVPPRRTVELLRDAARIGLKPYGLTFPVGSQCRDVESWARAIQTCYEVHRELSDHGQPLEMLSIGGGQPIHHTRPVPSLAEIGHRVMSSVAELFGLSPPLLSVEPGRAIVGRAGTLVASVIGHAERNGETWIYLDAGVFNALMETIEASATSCKPNATGPVTRSLSPAQAAIASTRCLPWSRFPRWRSATASTS